MKTAQTLKHFQGLSLTEKVNYLYQHGTFIMAIRYYDHKVNLYLFGRNYFEVFVNHKYAQIDKIQLLDHHSSRMKFYADQIKIQDINLL